MPFEIPQVEPQIEKRVGDFAGHAAALLRGCAVSYPIRGDWFDDKGGACALGAMAVGFGAQLCGGSSGARFMFVPRLDEMNARYAYRHGNMPGTDFDRHPSLTREQIAERIAAL
jgi:hypothetical protein